MYFVIQVGHNNEDDSIKQIKNCISKEIISDAFYLRRKVFRKISGNLVEFEEKMFPGYIFVSCDNVNMLHRSLFDVACFTKLLGRDVKTDYIQPLSESETIVIDELSGKSNSHICDISNITISEGKQIKVISGSLCGLEGKIKSINLHKRIAIVEISMGGTIREVHLGINIIKEL